MRHVTVVVYPDPEDLHPVEWELADASDLTRRAIHAFDELHDGTIVLLAEVDGNFNHYREIVESSPAVHEYAVSGDSSGFCYSRVESTPLLSELLRQKRAAEYIVEMPVEYTDDGGLQITMVGRKADFVGGPFDFPADFDIAVELVSASPYDSAQETPFMRLTDRQREVLETALRLGYYENPRQATQKEIADEFDIEPSTAGTHLRQIESHVLSQYTALG